MVILRLSVLLKVLIFRTFPRAHLNLDISRGCHTHSYCWAICDHSQNLEEERMLWIDTMESETRL